jgi:hypothetical protein
VSAHIASANVSANMSVNFNLSVSVSVSAHTQINMSAQVNLSVSVQRNQILLLHNKSMVVLRSSKSENSTNRYRKLVHQPIN